MLYELFYLIGASKEAELEKIKNDVSEIVTGNGGVFAEKETLEKRRMAYKIRHETHGIYIAQRFELEDTQSVSEISKKLNLHQGVMRFIISRADDLPALKSKEERIAESQQAEKRMVSSEKPKEEKREKVKEKKPVEEKKEKDREDIDKKLEEILNI